MGKKKKKTKKGLSAERYQTLLLRLLEAWDMWDHQTHVFWDYGPGERPHVIEAELRHVAMAENIPVRIVRGPRSLLLGFLEPQTPGGFRVKAADGSLKAESEKGQVALPR